MMQDSQLCILVRKNMAPPDRNCAIALFRDETILT